MSERSTFCIKLIVIYILSIWSENINHKIFLQQLHSQEEVIFWLTTDLNKEPYLWPKQGTKFINSDGYTVTIDFRLLNIFLAISVQKVLRLYLYELNTAWNWPWPPNRLKHTLWYFAHFVHFIRFMYMFAGGSRPEKSKRDNYIYIILSITK